MKIKNIILKKSILDNKHFTVVTNIISTAILVAAILICIYVVLTTKASEDSIGVPNIGGYSFLSVKSDSMTPTFNPGDLIVIKRYGKDEKHEYSKGDVITFAAIKKSGLRIVNSHRIVDINKGAGDDISYITKGDAEKNKDEKSVEPKNILGVYTGVRIPKLGKVFDFAQKPSGVLLMIILPAALIVIWQIFNYLRALAIDRQVVNANAPATAFPMRSREPQQYYPPAAESEKEAIIKEYLRQQQEEELKKQQIIEEYLAKQKELEEAEKAKAEEAKIKAIITEFLAQQKAAEQAEQSASKEEKTVEQSEQSASTEEKTVEQAEQPDSTDGESNS